MEDPTRARRLVDATIIATISTVVASMVAGMALIVYQEVNGATKALHSQEAALELLQKDVLRTQDLLTKELAPLKAHLEQMGNAEKKSVTHKAIRVEEELLDLKFKSEARNSQQAKQQSQQRLQRSPE